MENFHMSCFLLLELSVTKNEYNAILNTGLSITPRMDRIKYKAFLFLLKFRYVGKCRSNALHVQYVLREINGCY